MNIQLEVHHKKGFFILGFKGHNTVESALVLFDHLLNDFIDGNDEYLEECMFDGVQPESISTFLQFHHPPLKKYDDWASVRLPNISL